MINQISYSRILEGIYALSALRALTNDPELPGPLGRDEAPALEELAKRIFESLCIDLGYRCYGDSVDLPGDYRAALEEIVTDSLLAELTDRDPYRHLTEDLRARIRARLRPIPRNAGRFY